MWLIECRLLEPLDDEAGEVVVSFEDVAYLTKLKNGTRVWFKSSGKCLGLATPYDDLVKVFGIFLRKAGKDNP